MEKGWKDAESAISKVDVSKGFSSIAKDAESLKKASDELAKFGKSNPSLTALTEISSQFKKIEDAEKAASTEYTGYMDLISGTNTREKKLEEYKKELDKGVLAAEDAVNHGTATPEQQTLLREKDSIYAHIAETMGQLESHKAGDLLAIAGNMPDWVKLDDLTRDTVARLGGPGALAAKMEVDTLQAKNDIDAILNPPGGYEMTVRLHFDYTLPNGLPVGGAAKDGTSGADNNARPGNGVAVNPAGWNQYRPLDPQQYNSIVTDGGGAGGPFANAAAYAQVIKAAQAAGVDPRVLLSFLKYENNDGTNISAQQAANNNFAGIKFANQPGATQGTVVPENEWNVPGRPEYYAAFKDLESFLTAFTKNLTTGAYAGDYQSGNLYGVAKRYVGSDEPQRVKQYATYYDQYPAGSGGGDFDDPRYAKAAGAPSSAGGNGMRTWEGPDGTYTYDPSTQTLTTPGGEQKHVTGAGPGHSDAAPSTVAAPANATGSGAAIVDAAMADVGMKAFINQCEKWIEEKVQQATGRRGATGAWEDNANAGLAHAQQMGLEVKTPQPGDLVYYGDGKNGHVAIYIGNGKQASTFDAGGTAIHTEDVGPGAHYIRVPGVNDGKENPDEQRFGKTLPEEARGNTQAGKTLPEEARYPSGVPGTQNYRDPQAAYPRNLPDLTEPLHRLSEVFSRMDSKDVEHTIATEKSFSPILKELALAKLPENADATAKQNASNAALVQSVNLEVAWAQATDAVSKGAGDVEQKIQAVRDLGGPIGNNLANQLGIYQQIARVNKEIEKDKKHLIDIEQAHTALLLARRVEDEAASRKGQETQWKDARDKREGDEKDVRARWKIEDDRQSQTRKNEDLKRQENDRWQDRDRHLQDEQRRMNFVGTEAKRQLRDQEVALQKSEKLTRSLFTAEEQMLRGQVAGSGDRGTKNNNRELLAITVDYDKQQRLTAKSQMDNIKEAIQAEDRLVAQERYDFETKIIREKREHEDTIKRLDEKSRKDSQEWADKDKAAQRNKQIDDWAFATKQANDAEAHQRDLWRIQDKRNTEDAAYEKDVADTKNRITDNDLLLKGYDADLKSLQAIEAEFGRLIPLVGVGAAELISGILKRTDIAKTGTPGAETKVGNAPGPKTGTPGAELKVGNASDSNVSLAFLQRKANTLAPVGDTYHVNLAMDSGMASILDAEGQARMKRVAQEEVARSIARQRTQQAENAATGGARMAS
ncbi:MAG: NlpC/P60 family protein [Thermomicrobia bacterium]|nr:NlpC/P60 family protein [Thermomicrobia bacterium]